MTTRLDVYRTMIDSGLVPVFYMADAAAAQTFVADCLEGGVRVVEFTNRGTAALSVFRELRATFPDLILGIGSIIDAPTAAIFMAEGADFIVGQSFDADVARLCNGRKLAYMPGCGTLTEIHVAEQHGAEIVKLFPASVYGAGFIKAALGPSPWTRIMPTGGIDVTEASIKLWIRAGACCVGIGSTLAQVDDTAATCRDILTWIQEAREDA